MNIQPKSKDKAWKILVVFWIVVLPLGIVLSQDAIEEYERIDSKACAECHETGKHETVIMEDLKHSAHNDLECLGCHTDKDTFPHKKDPEFHVGCEGCRECHDKESGEYQSHGREVYGECEDMPMCADCHGDHDILSSDVKLSKPTPSICLTPAGNVMRI